MGLQFLLDQVKNAVFSDQNNPYQQGDTHGLIGTLEGLFGQHQQQQQQQGGGNDLSQQFPGIRSASEDRLGDPGDMSQGGQQGMSQAELLRQFPGLRSASEDPLGDPGA